MKSILINIRRLSAPRGLGLLLILLLLPPLYLLLFAVFRLSPEWLQHLSDAVVVSYFSNSLQVSGGAIATALVIGGIPAWFIQSFDFRGRRFCSFLQILPLTLPTYVTASIYLEASSSEFFYSRTALAVELGAAAAPWVYLFVRIALARISKNLVDAATLLGLDWKRRLLRLYLPLAAAPLVAAGALVGSEAINDYGAASRVGISTLSVGIYNQWLAIESTDIGLLLTVIPLVVAILVLIPTALVFLRKPSPSQLSLSQNHGSRLIKGRQSIALQFFCWIAVLPGFLIPISFSIFWTVQKFGRVSLNTLYGDALSTIVTGFAVVAACAAITLLFSALARVGECTGFLERSMWLSILNFLVPPLILSFALLKFSYLPFFQRTRLSILCGEVVRFLPLMLLPVAETMTRLPQALADSAMTLGLSRRQTFWRALFPQLKFAFAAGAVLVFLQSTNELTISLLLQPIGYGSLPLRIFYYSVTQLTRDASIWVLCSVVVCIYPVWALASFLDTGRGPHA